MTSPSQIENQAKDHSAVAEPDFATNVHKFWETNRLFVLISCGATLLVVAGFYGWQEFIHSRDHRTQEAYAHAVGSPDKLAGFASEHAEHVLAGIALLQVADARYSAGDFPAALTGYQQAVAKLTNPTFKARAQLGVAVSRLASGDQTGAEAELKTLSTDAALDKNIRAEATYHLAILLNEAGRKDEVRALLDEISKIDAAGIWAGRAMQLRASLIVDSNPAVGLKP